MKKRVQVVALVASVSVVVLAGCGTGVVGDKGGNLTPNFVNGSTSASSAEINEPFVMPALAQAGNPVGDMIGAMTTIRSASTRATNLESLKYFIQSIRLCQSVTMSGSGYSNASGCFYLYEFDAKLTSDNDYYAKYGVTKAIADTDSDNRFIDLMTAAGRAKLQKAKTVDKSLVGTYNYGLIDFYRPIKIKASFSNYAGTKVYYSKKTETTNIKASTTDLSGGVHEVVRFSGNTTTSGAEEMTYMLNNGGTVFPFLKPFVVSADDVTQKKAVTMDLVFNPDYFASANESSGTCSLAADGSDKYTVVGDTTNCVSFNLPYVKMNPVPRKSGEKTYKEVYTFNYITTSTLTGGYDDTSKLRVEVYYNSADTDKTAQGFDVAVIPTSTTTSLPTSSPISAYSLSQSGMVLTVKSYNGTTSLSNFTRRANGTATLTCINATGLCTAAGQTASLSYTYDGEVVVSTD